MFTNFSMRATLTRLVVLIPGPVSSGGAGGRGKLSLYVFCFVLFFCLSSRSFIDMMSVLHYMCVDFFF